MTKQYFYIRVATHNDHDCWVADGTGDPPRTLVLANAKQFKTAEKAEVHAQKLLKKYRFEYTVIKE